MDMRMIVVLALAAITVASGQKPRPTASDAAFTNSIGVRMIRVPAGFFRMGNDQPTDPKKLRQFELLRDGDYDEKPVHEVRLAHDFYLSETEITAEQFARFRFDHQDTGVSRPYATGIRWDDAAAVCAWLSRVKKSLIACPRRPNGNTPRARAGEGISPPGNIRSKTGSPIRSG
jgi:formylglycine-generating enzyme required for sulfatase activity